MENENETARENIEIVNTPIDWIFDDGGRANAGFKGKTQDCVCRAIAIITQKPYLEIYNKINELAQTERKTKNKKSKSTARTGVYKDTIKKVMDYYNFEWTPLMFIGSGCKTHLRKNELPTGDIICRVSKHLVAVKNGVIHDTHLCSRMGSRCVYGYWRLKGECKK